MMRGEVFNEFLEYAAQTAPSATAWLTTDATTRRYEAAGRYDLDELIVLVDRLAAARGETRGSVLASFGSHLFGYFADLYPAFLGNAGSALALLTDIDAYVHAELKKLYPDADFPTFACVRTGPGELTMTYGSARPLADLAGGLIRGCIAHFGDAIQVSREDLPGAPGTAARFVLRTVA